MGLIDSLTKIVHQPRETFGGFLSSFSNTQPVVGNLPIYPEWFFTAPIGQPRAINISEVRQFAASHWVQMVLNTIKKEVSTIDWEIIPKNPEDDITKYQAEIKLIEQFLENVNTDSESIDDMSSMLVTDIGEIDAGTLVKVFTEDSYQAVMKTIYNEQGQVIDNREVLELKPIGQRKLVELRAADGSTFLKKVDIYKRLECYYQYSFKNPRTNPKLFLPEEVIYFHLNKKSYSLYGYSPVQSTMQVLEILMNAARWNKDFFKNNAIPDGIVSLVGANSEALKKFQEDVERKVQGKPHKLLFQNTEAKFESFMKSARDMEWLDGQKWYSQIVFASFGVSPVEAGFHQNVNQGNQAGQERITVKNGIKPYLELLEKKYTRELLPEILGVAECPLQFKYKPKEHVEEQIEFEQQTTMVEMGLLTPNEFRKLKGLTPVKWGNEPLSLQLNTPQDVTPQQDPKSRETDSRKKNFQKKFERYLDERTTNSDTIRQR
jgi:HK97 family phage portal protein